MDRRQLEAAKQRVQELRDAIAEQRKLIPTDQHAKLARQWRMMSLVHKLREAENTLSDLNFLNTGEPE